MTAIEPVTKPQLLAHLINLGEDSRHFRFGYSPTDEALAMYVDSIPDGDIIIGIRRHIISTVFASCMHISISKDQRSAEMGLSTLAKARRHGFAERLLKYGIDVLRNRGIRELYSVCLPDNKPLLALLSKNGITAVYKDGDREAHIAVPMAGLDSIMHEVNNNRLVIMDTTMRPWADVWAKMLGVNHES